MDGEISPAEVQSLLEEGADVRVVDIRAPAAFARGHVPGSENIPFDRLTQRVPELEGASHIVTVCPHGQASQQAARLINSYEGTASATVESMRGGLEAWPGSLEALESDDNVDAGAPF